MESIGWLEWESASRCTQIQHALNGKGEKKIGRYHADGFSESTATVFEYNYCKYHGCETCFPNDRTKYKIPPSNQSVSELKSIYDNKVRYLQNCGCQVVVKWNCLFQKDKEQNPRLKEFLDSLDLTTRLDPRDSFFGGRTDALKLHHVVHDDEEILYVDFTSLYPYVDKYCEYPTGHPQIITADFHPLDNYFGEDEERAILGTWCTPELKKAVKMGYVVLKIYEVYHFQDSSKQLFKEYIDTFLKCKQENSDWPHWCDSDGKKRDYVEAYYRNEGIRLDPSRITHNPGLRCVSKHQLNNFWGGVCTLTVGISQEANWQISAA
ncbi:uncharacterized protein LOC110452922 [Mizuhopecten yessoensis]|uniref:uncharacterized protein LOC110452922 n=1 Tax=Mizuhopecten yessoensis TaxID=6573 RepID=UPI000B457BFA|nr:uncharacterized protein LOC110452922 [Mizuhopecten yessoensis]